MDTTSTVVYLVKFIGRFVSKSYYYWYKENTLDTRKFAPRPREVSPHQLIFFKFNLWRVIPLSLAQSRIFLENYLTKSYPPIKLLSETLTQGKIIPSNITLHLQIKTAYSSLVLKENLVLLFFVFIRVLFLIYDFIHKV